MYRFLSILLSFSLVSLSTFSQVLNQAAEQNGSYREDTALVNSYVSKIQNLLSQSTKAAQDTSRVYLQKIYDLSQYRNYSRGLAEYYRLSSSLYNARYLYDSSGLSTQKELYWARQSNDPMEVAEAYAAMGIRYEYLDQLDSAAKYYLQAVHTSDSVGNRHFSGSVYNNLAIIFYNIGDSKNAEKYAIEGYRIGKALKDSSVFLNCLINLAGIKKDLMESEDTALTIYRQVIKEVGISPTYQLLAFNAFINEGDILRDMKRYSEALAKYESVLDHKEEIGSYLLGYVYSGIGNTLFEIKKYPEAEANLNKAIEINKRIRARQELSENYASLAKVKKAARQLDQALYYQDQYDSLKDTLLNETTRKNMHLLLIKYQTAQKDKQIAEQQFSLAQKQHAIQRKNTWIIVFLGSLAAVIAILMLSVRSYRHKRRLHEQSLLTLQKQHELDRLQAKMEAREDERNRISREMHDDIGSALTTILYLSEDIKNNSSEKNKNTAQQIAGTAGVVVDKMNEIIWSMNQEYDTLDDLIAYTRQHAAQFLENHGIEYQFKTPDPVPEIHLPGEERRNIYLVIKEALHNIVKHAHATKASVEFYLDSDLKITIRDNGIGVNSKDLRRFGNGLRNMQQRMEAIGGTFHIAEANGTRVQLKCPLPKGDKAIVE